MKRLLSILGGFSLLVAGSSTFFSTPAYAIPGTQARCVTYKQSTFTSYGDVPIPGLSVSIDNGASARRAIVHLSADMCVPANSEVRVSYSVDGGPPQVGFGPTNLGNHQEFCETRSTMAVIPLAAGLHTITPYWRVQSSTNVQAEVIIRCVTVEGYTQ